MRTRRRHLLVSLLASSALLTVETPGRAGPPAARQFYVATSGNAAGDGSLARPRVLQTATNEPSVVEPGHTITLGGGTCWGHYASSPAGRSSAPIAVQSYPGEWARIDGHAPPPLAASLTSTDTTVSLAS